jgi:hypothetical protein
MALAGKVVSEMSPPDASRAPVPGYARVRNVATPTGFRVGPSGMQWASRVEFSALDAASNRGTPPDSRCKDIPWQ